MTGLSGAAGTPLPPLTLVLGGAASGKSRYAECLIERAAAASVYVATAAAGDDEMAERIRRHRARRGERWITVEAPLDLAERLPGLARPGRPVLVDCLTLWLSNLMLAGRDPATERARLAAALTCLAGPAVLVASEVGLGIVPDNPLARRFRDHAGQLHQALARSADCVLLIAAGLPLILKDVPPSRP